MGILRENVMGEGEELKQPFWGDASLQARGRDLGGTTVEKKKREK